MSDDQTENVAPPAALRRRHWWRWFIAAIVGVVALVAAVIAIVDTDIGHRFVAERIATIRTANGLRFSVGRIDGSLYSDTRLVDLRVYDPKGLVFQAPSVALSWHPFAWARNELAIDRLYAPHATMWKTPETIPTGRNGPILPDFDIRIGRLAIDSLVLAPPVLGQRRVGRLMARADIRAGRAMVDVRAIVAGTDRLAFRIDAEPDRDRFDIDAQARGAANGILAAMSGLARPIALDIDGDGSWARWSGRAIGSVRGDRVVDLALTAQAGRYTLGGTLVTAPFAKGKLLTLSAPRVALDGSATFADRRLDGRLTLRSAGLAVEMTGVVDLARNAFRNIRISAALLRPQALFRNMTGRRVTLRAILDGPFATAAFDYRLAADRFAFDKTGFEQARAAGRGRFSRSPVIVPVRFTAARVTGVGDVAGGILRNLALDGKLRVTSTTVSGDDLRLRSDKLSGRITLVLDLKTGRYQVGVNGALGRYLIPGLGLVDVRSTLRVVPGANGKGTRIVGQGTAQMLRLDNSFFRSLAGGLPRIVTNLERLQDGTLMFRGLVLTAPSIRIAGNGYRRRDGSFHFEGAGRQAQYGPLTLKLDGRIERPTLDLVFTAPNATLGLSNVRAHFDPTPLGYAFTAAGGSRLGDFTGNGAILLPRGAPSSIVVAALDVAGTRASGTLGIVAGGFDGRLGVAGGGIAGELLFRPVAGIQRIETHLVASSARLAGGITLRRGRLDFVTLLDPAGTTINGSIQGVGLRRGALSLARLTASATLRDGVGEIRAAIAGSRGRAFDIQTVTQATSDRYSITARGTLDRRPLELLEPAIVTRDGDGWRVAPTRLTFAGGEARLGGRLSPSGMAIDAGLTRMPLAILDIGYPGLGLGGTVSGKVDYATTAGGAPTGHADLTIRGLSRSGLTLSSRPIDVGLAAALSSDKIGVRAVMASGGKIIGRGQALLRPMGGGDLVTRVRQAPLTAQLRYVGPADTLWRLTGVELFDLSGPVSIAADAGGRVANPIIRGRVQASGARIESAVTGTVLTNVQAVGRFGGSRLVIDRFGADAGKGGRVTGTGQFDFAAASGLGIDLRLQADKAAMIARDDIAATVTGPLSFTSDGSGGVIAGDVVLDKSRYRLGQAAAAGAVPKLNIREINVPGGDEEEARPVKPWTLAVKARAANQLLVSGLGLSSEWSADLDIGGEPQNPAITGRATMIRGDYEFAGREFELERGIIRFSGETPANPALDIAANADSTGLRATIRVTGTALKPEIAFSSTPALPEDELLSRLLFGTSITNLSAPEALQLAAAVAALQNGGNGLNPINAVRRAAGLDRLRILPADVQTGQGTSIAAGKYVTRRLYAEIVTDGQGYSATQVEFQVTRWLSLLSSISTLGRQSVNVRVSKDY